VSSDNALTQLQENMKPAGWEHMEKLIERGEKGLNDYRQPKISILTHGSINACDHYRAYGIVRMLDKAGLIQARFISNLNSLDVYLNDLVICFRPKDPSLHQVINDSKMLDTKILVDYDDNIFNVMASNFLNVNFTEQDKQNSLAITNKATQLTVSTNHLKGVLEPHQKRIAVIPNLLDWNMVEPLLEEFPREKTVKKEQFTVAWAGTQSHTEDLFGRGWPYLSALMRFLDEFPDTRLVMFGMSSQEILDRYYGRVHFQQPLGFFQYLPFLASAGIDLMTYPLYDHQFNHAKSNIRWLESSALKIPLLAANIPSYADLGEKYCKTVKNTEEGWYEALKYAYHNREEMAEITENAHNYARDEWSVQARWPVWLAAYTAAIQGKCLLGDYTPRS